MITGRTRIYCILADPVTHVRTPQAFNEYLEQHKADGVLVPLHTPSDRLGEVVAGLRGVKNIGGLIVTIPHKLSIGALCDRLEPSARISGATNVIRREADGELIGGNFDGAGFVTALEGRLGSLAGRRGYLMGTGGAGRAIACALAEAGVRELLIANRSPHSALELVALLQQAFPATRSAVTDSPSCGCRHRDQCDIRWDAS